MILKSQCNGSQQKVQLECTVFDLKLPERERLIFDVVMTFIQLSDTSSKPAIIIYKCVYTVNNCFETHLHVAVSTFKHMFYLIINDALHFKT